MLRGRLVEFGSTVAVLLIVPGCGNPDAPKVSGSTEQAMVKGIVTIRGKPATNGEVSFRAFNINRPNVPLKTASIEKDGRYTAQVYIGENFVEVHCKEISGRKNLALLENEQPVKIRSGEQILDIELPPNGPLQPR
jgi:hypothetical protein